MATERVTRRELLQAGAATLPLIAATRALAQVPTSQPRRLTVGLATTSFTDCSNAQLAAELRNAGVGTVQLFLTQTDSKYWKYNGRNDLADLTPERCRAIAETYHAADIAVHSIGVYTNLMHPDPEERKANLAYFEAMMAVGRHMGVGRFITEAGHYYPPEPAAGLPYDLREEVWKAMVATTRELATLAERHDATVLFEPYFGSFFASAKRTRVFLEEVDSPRIRTLLDPANLLELNDLEEMFDQLAPWIDCLHAKDRKLHTQRGVPAGQGDLDYRKFVTLAAERTPAAPMILEYVGSKDYRQALEHLRSTMRELGVSES